MLLFSVLLLARCCFSMEQLQVQLGPNISPLFPSDNSNGSEQIPGPSHVQHREPFPTWLKDLTGLQDWPGENPPYIPLSYVDMSKIPNNIPLRGLGDCKNVEREHCSFDCYRCIAAEDIVSCPVLTQTFDDGPSPSTPKLMNQLQGRTTFFSQGINVIRFPETFRQQHAQGHLMGTHTWSHANLPGLSNEDIIAQIEWSIWAMNATAGIVPIYFRPPYGAIDDRVRAITRQFKLIPVFWDRDTYDWKINEDTVVEADIFKEAQIWKKESGGGIILEHDSTIRTVNIGIEISKILGYRQLTVAECVNGQWYQNQ